jgi:type IV pilus assembly protein PilB
MATEAFSNRISAVLVKHKAVDPKALADAETEAAAKGVRLEKLLLEKKLVRPSRLTLAISDYLDIPPISLAHFAPSKHMLELIPKEVMARRLVMPLAKTGRTLTVAVGDPFDVVAIDEISVLTGLQVVPLVAAETEITDLLSKLSAEATQGLAMEEVMKDDEGDIELLGDKKEEQSLDEMLESAEGAPVIRMVNMMLVEALRTRASDIHIEPMEKKVRLRYRIDGNLSERPGPPKGLQSAVISRVKILSDLNIAERRIPQDGRFNIKALGKEVDLRVSILPTVHGEKVVMRTLDKSSLAPSLNALGLDELSLKRMQYAIGQPHGIILVTGPTGSGKTTTLYSCLQDLNTPDMNIVTCEDPVEYQLEGVNQVQIHTEVGLTFAAALRSILRQDPDVVLVGEIRDNETALIAVKAALTGHLVLSTLHTNDASGAVTRLVDMGVEPFMLGASLILTQAQRLYRKLCMACRKPHQVPLEILEFNRIDPKFFEGSTLYKPVGCPRCDRGFKGRGAIMEVLEVNDEIRDGVLKRMNSSEIREIARKNGMKTLKEVGLTRVKEGLTSIEAALEVTGGE